MTPEQGYPAAFDRWIDELHANLHEIGRRADSFEETLKQLLLELKAAGPTTPEAVAASCKSSPATGSSERGDSDLMSANGHKYGTPAQSTT